MPLQDLTHPIENGMQTFPGDPDVCVARAAELDADGVRVCRVELGSHAGTHVDAPSHTEPNGATLGAYEVDAFRFETRVVDCTDLGAREAIPPARVPDCDEADLLAFRTGWDAHWGSERYLDHPYLSPAAAERCAERGVAVAVDALNPDPTPTGDAGDDEPEGFPAHHALLGEGLLVLENLTRLDTVPRRFTLHAYPLHLDADGAPVRAVAEW